MSLKKGWPPYDIASKGQASKGHVKNVDSYDNPERVMLSLVLASPMRKSTFPLLDLELDSCVKLSLRMLPGCCLFVVTNLGLVLLFHVEIMKKSWTSESVL